MEQIMVEKLIDTAIEQLKFSYTPYSNFKVGAALLNKERRDLCRMQYRKCILHTNKLCGENCIF